jgi:hypothetical protein
VLFERRLQKGLSDGSITVAFRRWRRPQVVAGRQYRSPVGMIEVDAVTLVRGMISAEDANAAGYASVQALLQDMKGAVEGQLYRLALHRGMSADPRTALAATTRPDAAELTALRQKLARLDAVRVEPWTLDTLRAIEDHPGTRAGDLYADLGWATLRDFKLHVRKLKRWV